MVGLASPLPAVRGIARPARRPVPRPASRDGFIDALRAFGTVAVMLLHWLIPVVAWDGHGLAIGNALSSGLGWLVTWPLQVMPLMFFAAGAGTWWSRRSATETVPFLRRRLSRLLPPVLVFLGAWLALIGPAALALGVPRAAVARAAGIAPQLLWFVAVLVLLLAVTPLCLRAYARWGLRVPAVLAGAAVGVDLVRFGTGFGAGHSWIGYLNILFVWLVPYVLGFAYADGTLTALRRPALVAAGVGSLATLVLLVSGGPYPLSMVGLPGDTMSNMNPPTICLLAVTGYQIAIALLLRGLVLRAVSRPRVAAAVGFVQARSMTLYLWHLTAMFIVVGIVLFGLGRQLPEAWTADWWATRPLWYVTLAALLAGCVKVFGRVERVGLPGAAWFAAHRAHLTGFAGAACVLASVLLFITQGALAGGAFGPQLSAALLAALGLALIALSRRPAPAAQPATVPAATVPAQAVRR